jgi:hypothetical protein
MKYTLPILTAALALIATTASAIEYYYPEYYSNTNYDVSSTTVGRPSPWNQDQTIPQQQQTIDYGDYKIVRTSPDYGVFSGDIINHYKISITGDNVDLYLADWMDTATGKHQEDALTSLNKNLTSYGYYFVDGNTHLDANGVEYDHEIFKMQDAVNDSSRYVVLETYPANDGDTVRHGYYLGNFSNGDEIEIYMQNEDGSIRSNSYNYEGGRYFVDNYDQVVAARLGYGEGITAEEKEIARKTMPIAELAPSSGRSVFFGIYAGAPEAFLSVVSDGTSDIIPDDNGTFGSPLPGGLQIALIAGLFGLGFWYVRRRKSIAA